MNELLVGMIFVKIFLRVAASRGCVLKHVTCQKDGISFVALDLLVSKKGSKPAMLLLPWGMMVVAAGGSLSRDGNWPKLRVCS